MTVVPLSIARVSDQLQGSVLLANMQSQQADLLNVEQQISTGQRLSQASDDPAAALGIMRLNSELAASQTYNSGLTYAAGYLNTTDSTMTSLSGLLTQAQQIASSDVGSTTSASQRQADGAVVDSLLQQALNLANTQYQGAAVFGGANSTQTPFAATTNGYVYQGSTGSPALLTDTGATLAYSVNGNDVFGGLSAQMTGTQDLTPQLYANMLLSNTQGVRGQGVTPGVIQIQTGGQTAQVDLSHAATVSDVTSAIQAQLTAMGSSATIGTTGPQFYLSNPGSSAVTLSDVSGSLAADLGLNTTTSAGGTTWGGSVQPAVTALTPLSSLRDGAGLDPAGFKITNGSASATITLTGLTTVQDLVNAINSSGTNVRAQINAAGTGIDVLNAQSGSALTIAENGGTTASELGIRSLSGSTPLAQLNSGQGVTPIAQTATGPKGSITITCTDGSSFAVTTDAVRTPAQLVAAINSASGNTTVTAALNASGNGITLTDSSGGTGNLTVAPGADFQSNGTDLGLFSATPSGATLVGSNMTFSTDDFRITRQDGSSFTVSLQGCSTFQDVINAINNAAGNTNPATQVTAALATTGNGLQLTDPTTGAGTLSVTGLNGSTAASQIGLTQAAVGGTMTGTDVNPIETSGVFAALLALRNALNANDTAGIQTAATGLTAAAQQVVQLHGVIGAQAQDISNRQDQVTNDQTQLNSSLSTLADTDMTTAITQFQALQNAYEGSLKVAQTMQQMNLLDFLQ